ncbi:sulfotransferase domain-containing protein [Flavobacteriales bacterium]|nr:sulfotransferase domain-containing protein [Flavobacteriales bacterium]
MKVNTFIVGAPKTGTTSLYYYLNQHTNVCMSSIKEPNFFSAKEVNSLFYKSQIVDDINEYHKLFSQNKKQIIGEASVSYLFFNEVPNRIYKYNPKAKIIILLRNPIERALSHYLMDFRLGFCSENFEDIIAQPEIFPQYYQQYLELGNYFLQLKRYLNVFNENQLSIVFYDDLKSNSQKVMKHIFSFLEIEFQNLDYSIQNSFLSPSNIFVSELYKFNSLRKIVKSLFPEPFLSLVKSIFFSNNSKPTFSDSIIKQLNAYYKSDIVELEKLLNKDLSKWDLK